jgi:hypothetical protein
MHYQASQPVVTMPRPPWREERCKFIWSAKYGLVQGNNSAENDRTYVRDDIVPRIRDRFSAPTFPDALHKYEYYRHPRITFYTHVCAGQARAASPRLFRLLVAGILEGIAPRRSCTSLACAHVRIKSYSRPGRMSTSSIKMTVPTGRRNSRRYSSLGIVDRR